MPILMLQSLSGKRRPASRAAEQTTKHKSCILLWLEETRGTADEPRGFYTPKDEGEDEEAYASAEAEPAKA